MFCSHPKIVDEDEVHNPGSGFQSCSQRIVTLPPGVRQHPVGPTARCCEGGVNRASPAGRGAQPQDQHGELALEPRTGSMRSGRKGAVEPTDQPLGFCTG